MTYQAGQEVFVVYNRRSVNGKLQTIDRVGRKWAYLKGWAKERFDIETGLIDGGQYTAPGAVYESESAYEAWKRSQELRRSVRAFFSGNYELSKLSDDQVRQVAGIIGVSE